MHAALCLSGNFRDYQQTLPTLIKFINNLDKCDVFMLYDKSEKKEDVFKMIQSLNPKKVNSVSSLDDCNNVNMWFKIKESYLICQQYAKENSINYDIIIRCRYDLILSNDFDINKLKIENNTIYIGEIEDHLFRYSQKVFNFNKKFLLDEFFFGKPDVVKNYFTFYDLVIKSSNKCLDKRLGELDFFNYSQLLGDKVKQVPFHYVMYKWRNDFFGYIYKKWNSHPSFIKSFVFNKGNLIVIIFIVLIILLVNKELQINVLKKKS